MDVLTLNFDELIVMGVNLGGLRVLYTLFNIKREI